MNLTTYPRVGLPPSHDGTAKRCAIVDMAVMFRDRVWGRTCGGLLNVLNSWGNSHFARATPSEFKAFN